MYERYDVKLLLSENPKNTKTHTHTDVEFELKSTAQKTVKKQSPSKGKLIIEEIVSGLKLNNNDLNDLSSFATAVSKVTSSQNVQFLDLSFNQLDEVGDDLASFENLNSLYLTGNKIRRFSDIFKLKGLSGLRSLSLQGNPISERKDYRLKILHAFPTLSKLDFTAVTRADRDRVATWAKIWGPENEALMETKRLRATARSLEREKKNKK